MKKVVIVDYSLGNLFSVQQAFLHMGVNALVSHAKADIESADALVLPGVGAFGDAMETLRQKDLVNPIKDFVSSERPFLGICLGLQLLFEESEEFGVTKGLGLIPGTIKRFRFPETGPRVPVPQIAWNRIRTPPGRDAAWENTALRDVTDGEFMYFVHSYYVNPTEADHVLCETEYEGFSYCSAVLKDNIFATQFHPEKSADAGLSIYRNWAARI